MLVTVWVLSFSAIVVATGGALGGSSIPDSWPTKEECDVAAVKAQKYIAETRPDLKEIEVRCTPHRKIVDEK